MVTMRPSTDQLYKDRRKLGSAAAVAKLGEKKQQDMRNDIVNGTEHLTCEFTTFVNAQCLSIPRRIFS